jgi:ATP-binding protein involved in chromosome partitioning
MPMPDEIIGLLRSKITFKWSDGHESVFAARHLRLACRCAMCVEETSGEALLDPKTVPDTIRARGIDLVGQYAIQIHWTDNHDAGIYNFRDLRANCPCETCAALRAQGKVPQ